MTWLVGRLDAVYLPSYLDTAHLRDGRAWESMQRHPFWHRLNSYCSGEINVEEPLKDEKQYIFCQFPHGACKRRPRCCCFALPSWLVLFVS
jgi:hypothetical protein